VLAKLGVEASASAANLAASFLLSDDSQVRMCLSVRTDVVTCGAE
jgi:hypothetical protein